MWCPKFIEEVFSWTEFSGKGNVQVTGENKTFFAKKKKMKEKLGRWFTKVSGYRLQEHDQYKSALVVDKEKRGSISFYRLIICNASMIPNWNSMFFLWPKIRLLGVIRALHSGLYWEHKN